MSEWLDEEQVETVQVSVAWIMQRPTFALGVADARAGRRYHRDYDQWSTNNQWSYERGRAWAVLTPRDVPLRRNGRLTTEALLWFMRHDDII